MVASAHRIIFLVSVLATANSLRAAARPEVQSPEAAKFDTLSAEMSALALEVRTLKDQMSRLSLLTYEVTVSTPSCVVDDLNGEMVVHFDEYYVWWKSAELPHHSVTTWIRNNMMGLEFENGEEVPVKFEGPLEEMQQVLAPINPFGHLFGVIKHGTSGALRKGMGEYEAQNLCGKLVKRIKDTPPGEYRGVRNWIGKFLADKAKQVLKLAHEHPEYTKKVR
ncbi:hypothetical protein FOZ60_010697 [Perkinsus olseni]|uniref:Uncharacterized protein n=1 Tax=Perkinsus olseni TaxID=32597 RepID=A0A7J6UCC9_PEROL|nr:hypothetical protein FOZ60_010697 [Perkinsus olseni]KAF4754862.1 hypothetical protein FOZ62_030645 [Perkinsus olseni]